MDSKVSGGTIAFSEQTISMAEGSEIPRIEPNLRTTNEFTSPARFGVDDGLLDGDSPTQPPRTPLDPEGGVLDRPQFSPKPRTPPPFPWQPPRDDFPTEHPQEGYYINYSTKKTIAQGMMDLALLTANASQLRYIVHSPYWDLYHKINIGLIITSIVLQIVVGVFLIFIGRYDYRRKEHKLRAQVVNNITVILIFTITVLNIFIATFGVDDYRPYHAERPLLPPPRIDLLKSTSDTDP